MKRIVLLLLFLGIAACQMRPVIGQDWIGRDASFIEKILGQPVVTRTEGNNKIAAYRVEECSILVFFDDQARVAFVDNSGDCRDIVQNFTAKP